MVLFWGGGALHHFWFVCFFSLFSSVGWGCMLAVSCSDGHPGIMPGLWSGGEPQEGVYRVKE